MAVLRASWTSYHAVSFYTLDRVPERQQSTSASFRVAGHYSIAAVIA